MSNLEFWKCGRKKERDNCRNVALGHVTLERLVFDLSECPFVGTMINLLDGKNSVT